MIVPIHVATDGYIGSNLNTLSISVNGYLTTVIIETITPSGGGYLSKGISRNLRRKEREKEKNLDRKEERKQEEEILKRITVIVTINNKEYSETKIVKDIPGLTVDDIDVEINTNDKKPKITINVLKK